jgi:hypothetical protein
MKFHIEILQTATDDLQDSYDWYEEQRAGLGDQLVYDIEENENLVNVTAVFHTSRDPGRF